MRAQSHDRWVGSSFAITPNRYKYENNKIVEDAHSNSDFGGARTALTLLRERQKAHVAQFMRTEEAFAQAEESERGTEEAMRAVLEASAKSGTQETILEVGRFDRLEIKVVFRKVFRLPRG